MQAKHWDKDRLLNRLYGLEEPDSHFEQCELCQRQWAELRQRHTELVSLPEVPAEWLYAQRQRIFQRIERPSPLWWSSRLASSLASLAVVILAVMLLRPQPPAEPVVATNDSQLFTEVYGLVESPEPLAAQPLYGLFED